MDEDVALAHRREHVDALALLALQTGLGHGRPRRVAQVAEAGQPHELPEVGEVEQAVDLVDLALLDLQRVHELLAQRRAHAGADLQAHGLAEAPPAQLGLDGGEQVVGLVGDLEVGVARHPERAVLDDLHAREERVEVLGDQVLHRHERRALRRRDEAWQQLLGHLDAGERRDCVCRVADEHRERSERLEM